MSSNLHETCSSDVFAFVEVRSAVSKTRLSMKQNGQVRYELKTPYRDGTTHVVFSPLDFCCKIGSADPKAESEPEALPWVVRPPALLITLATRDPNGYD